jgi:hypothetical protein
MEMSRANFLVILHLVLFAFGGKQGKQHLESEELMTQHDRAFRGFAFYFSVWFGFSEHGKHRIRAESA